MTTMRKSEIASRFPLRRGLSEAEAAIYVSLSPSKFRDLVNKGEMPRPRLIGTRRIWDVTELDAAFLDMPHEGGDRDHSWDYLDAPPTAKIR
jgi:hypothetical protein